jgi:ArsR family transcriptional regulator, arsenate/arsenite/antimonite-responsive transcriptional repressor
MDEKPKFPAAIGAHPLHPCCSEEDLGVTHAFKALGHPVRMSIVRWLAVQDACCCGEICRSLPLAQSTVSQHLDLLRKAGIVNFRQEGNRSFYRLDREALAAMERLLSNLGNVAHEGEAL